MDITVKTAQDLGLSAEEFEMIKQILGRVPNFTELSIFSVMWSEHAFIQEFYQVDQDIAP